MKENKKEKRAVVIISAVILLGIIYVITLPTKRHSQGIAVDTQKNDTMEDTEFLTATALPEKTTLPGNPVNGKLPEKDGDRVAIHICGEVKNPGVYLFSETPRVVDVIKKAGGFTKKADTESINQAEKVADGTQLVIEDKSSKRKRKTSGEGKTEDNRINLNTAAKEELMTLPGIGEAKAEQIITFREENGRFSQIEDIKKISGIKDGVFNRIRDMIKV